MGDVPVPLIPCLAGKSKPPVSRDIVYFDTTQGRKGEIGHDDPFGRELRIIVESRQVIFWLNGNHFRFHY
jgi:hypothetical protein